MTMALRVFVSYSQREDQLLALRLQTLASTRPGLHVYVPPASTRGRGLSQSGSDLQELHEANLVLAIISRAVSSTMQKELEFAQELGKPIVPIVLGNVEVNGLPPGQPVFYVDPLTPWQSEHQIVEYLGRAHLGKANVEGAVGLILLAVGLLILAKK
jgi:hypothetical protein